MKGEVYRLPARGSGHQQKGRRFAVVLQPDWLTLSTWIVAFTSTTARETSFRPTVTIADQQTLVMCDQLDTVDLRRLTEPAGFLTGEETQRVDEALALVLDL
ncbi:MAG: type II toxin-antitoxin system PemK/MazF family toxin [Mycobacterium sp.]